MINLFKYIDTIFGTPVCYFFGLFNKKKEVPKSETHNILIIKLMAMGDIIVFLPSIRALRKRYPHAKITFLTTPAMVPVLRHIPDLDEIIEFGIPRDVTPWGFWHFIQKLRKLKFNVAIDVEQYYRLTGLIMWLAHIPNRIGFDVSGQGRNTMLTVSVKYNDTLHEVKNFGKLVEALGAEGPTETISPIFNPHPEEDIQQIKSILPEPAKTIAIHPGTSATAKSRRWAPENFAKVADVLANEGYRIVFTGAKEEEPIIKNILSYAEQNHTNLVGKTSLNQLLELFRQVRLIISLDTGPLHLAATTDTPILGLYGANTPIKWGPFGSQNRAIYHGPFPPCTQQQYGRVCKHPEGYHMGDITAQEVIDITLEMLKENS